MSSIQSQLDAQAINKLTAIKSVISNSDQFSANQMKCYALHAMGSSIIAIDSMSDKQLNQFQDGLIKAFKYKNWI